ncbi:MAG: class I SAM-dependent methyltransferase [Lachnospiraceae bacterium]|nr:class I SAM-dependent methyltransferase [Lachnospiraceae bacterium]
MTDYSIGHQQIDRWIDGVSYEVAFWSSYLASEQHKTQILTHLSSKEDIQQPLGDFNPKILNEDFKVLDVGCGMAYHNCPYINGHKIDLHYVDPLAFFYNDIAASKNAELPKIEFAMVEYLSSFYEKGSVSLVLIQNALDHCFQPVRGIIESMKLLKTGGTLYLFHHKNEAEHENYIGFHQFNIDLKDSALTIWNREASYNINELLADCAHIEVEEINDHIRARIIKDNDNVPATQADDIPVLAEQIMYCISHLMDTSYTGKIQKSARREKLLHAVASRVPAGVKEKIKAMKKK